MIATAFLSIATRLAVALALSFAAALAFAPGAAPPVEAGASCDPARTHAPGSSNETIVTDDALTRDYILHVPPSYSGTEPTPLVLNFHGLGSDSAEQEAYSGMSTKADSAGAGFIAVYPMGTPTGFGGGRWNVTMAPPPDVDDVAFVDQLLDKLVTELCIDVTRVYSTGMSNGGLMSVRLACSLSSRIAAIAPVAGSYYPPLFAGAQEPCPDQRPIPVISFHGTADTVVPWAGGPGIFGVNFRLPIDTTDGTENVMGRWAGHDDCLSGRQEQGFTATVRLISYGDCAPGVEVQLYATDGAGHVWPGFAPSDEIEATDLLWSFFQSHQMASVGGRAELPAAARAASQAADAQGGASWPIAAIAGGLSVLGIVWLVRRAARR